MLINLMTSYVGLCKKKLTISMVFNRITAYIIRVLSIQNPRKSIVGIVSKETGAASVGN